MYVIAPVPAKESWKRWTIYPRIVINMIETQEKQNHWYVSSDGNFVVGTSLWTPFKHDIMGY